MEITTDENTILQRNKIKKLFRIVKYGLLSLPNYKGSNTDVKIYLNIAEAILFDFYVNNDYNNSAFGVYLLLMLPILSKVNIIDNEGFKLWCIIYFIWNIKFGLNYGQTLQQTFSHNFPALYTTALSFGYSIEELKTIFALLRSASIRTFYSQNLDWLSA
jgi:hypothetical protein